MKIRTLIIVSALALPAALSADGLLCSLGVGSSSPVAYATGCGSAFAYNDTFDWASLNPGALGPTSGPTYESSANPDMGGKPWTGTSGGETVTASLASDPSLSALQLDGNTAWVYTGNNQVGIDGYIRSYYNNTAVQLGFPTIDPSNPIPWYFGEALLSERNGAVPITIDFSHPVSGVGFQISTLSSPNFIATLVAYSSTGQVLGTFVLNTNGTGVGGPCLALQSSPFATCSTPAPFIGITDDELHLGANMIASIAIYTNVPNFAIGTMDMVQTPEPSVLLLAAAGFGLMAWRRRKAGSGPARSVLK